MAEKMNRVVVLEFACSSDANGQITLDLSTKNSLMIAAIDIFAELIHGNKADTAGGTHLLPIYRINAGGPAIGPYSADAFFVGGGTVWDGSGATTWHNGQDIDMSSAPDDAPPDLYRSERWKIPMIHWVSLEMKAALQDSRLVFTCEASPWVFRGDTIKDIASEFTSTLHHMTQVFEQA